MEKGLAVLSKQLFSLQNRNRVKAVPPCYFSYFNNNGFDISHCLVVFICLISKKYKCSWVPLRAYLCFFPHFFPGDLLSRLIDCIRSFIKYVSEHIKWTLNTQQSKSLFTQALNDFFGKKDAFWQFYQQDDWVSTCLVFSEKLGLVIQASHFKENFENLAGVCKVVQCPRL